MRYLTVILLLLMLGHEASSQEPMGSVYSETEMEDSISSLAIIPVKHPKRLLKKLIEQIELDALQLANDNRMYQLEAYYTLDGFPPFTASCNFPSRIDSIPVSIFVTNSLGVILKNVSIKGPYELTDKDSIRLKKIL